MNVAIIGSRSYTNYENFCKIVNECINKNSIVISQIISGGARGVDKMAEKYASDNNIPTKILKPEYDKYPGKYAPLKRNIDIVNNCDVVIAIVHNSSSGSKHAITNATKQNKIVYEYNV